jgi:hypothetical protein
MQDSFGKIERFGRTRTPFWVSDSAQPCFRAPLGRKTPLLCNPLRTENGNEQCCKRLEGHVATPKRDSGSAAGREPFLAWSGRVPLLTVARLRPWTRPAFGRLKSPSTIHLPRCCKSPRLRGKSSLRRSSPNPRNSGITDCFFPLAALVIIPACPQTI